MRAGLAYTLRVTREDVVTLKRSRVIANTDTFRVIPDIYVLECLHVKSASLTRYLDTERGRTDLDLAQNDAPDSPRGLSMRGAFRCCCLLTGVTPPRRSRVRAAAAVAAANSGPNLVLMGSHSGEESKRCTGLALKLGRRLLFCLLPHLAD